VQTQNLVTLGKVWGFVKYHHPAVTAGQRHWDYELFRIMPKVLAATNRETANSAMRDWISGLGDISTCSTCATLQNDNLHLSPNVDWIDEESVLGRDLAGLMRSIYRNRLQ